MKCKKILRSTGRRCSRQAQSGKLYCFQHSHNPRKARYGGSDIDELFARAAQNQYDRLDLFARWYDDIGAIRRRARDGTLMLEIPAGTKFYRAIEDFEEAAGNIGEFFASFASALAYLMTPSSTTETCNRKIYQFKTTKPLRLLDLSLDADFDVIERSLGAPRFPPNNPKNYLEEYFKGVRRSFKNIDMEVLQFYCAKSKSFGLDGIGVARSLVKDINSPAGYSPWHDEIALCDPSKVTQRTGIEIYQRVPDFLSVVTTDNRREIDRIPLNIFPKAKLGACANVAFKP